MFYFSKFNAGGNATAVGRRKRSESESGRARAAATENLESGTCTHFATVTGMDDLLLVTSRSILLICEANRCLCRNTSDQICVAILVGDIYLLILSFVPLLILGRSRVGA